MAEGYAISERDYRRIEETIRRVERMADINFRRRMPVGGWSAGTGSGMPTPTDRVPIFGTMLDDSGFITLTKAAHCNKLLWFDNYNEPPTGIGENCYVKMPVNPVIGDTYFMFLKTANGYYDCGVYPNTGQTIIMPSEKIVQTTSPAKFVNMKSGAVGSGLLILVCCAANTWISFDSSSSVIA